MPTKLNVLVALSVTLFAALPAQAQDSYPNRPIRLVLGFAAGGGTDAIVRGIAQKVSDILGQQVVVENKPGANGNIAAESVAKAPNDGYTLLYNTSSVVLSPALYPKLNYDVSKDFTPVSLTANLPIVVVASPKFSGKTIQDLVTQLKANPGKFNYASAGNGNITHLSCLLLLSATNATATHVPYKSEAPAVTDVAGGQVDFYCGTAPGVIPLIKDKRLNPLAVSTLKRMDSLPDVPTLSETVAKGLELGAWSGIVAPAGTSPQIIDKWNAALAKAILDKSLLEKFAAQGAEPKHTSPSQYASFIQSELTRWTKIIKQNQVTVD